MVMNDTVAVELIQLRSGEVNWVMMKKLLEIEDLSGGMGGSVPDTNVDILASVGGNMSDTDVADR